MHLDEAIPVMQMFLLAMVADKTIPLPGDVDIMTGGPPCQVRCAGRDAAVSLWEPAKRQVLRPGPCAVGSALVASPSLPSTPLHSPLYPLSPLSPTHPSAAFEASATIAPLHPCLLPGACGMLGSDILPQQCASSRCVSSRRT